MILPKRIQKTLLLKLAIHPPQVNATILGTGEEVIGVGAETGGDLGGNVDVALVLVEDVLVTQAVHSDS